MTAAPTYNRQYNFTGFQALAPSTPLPANEIDAEYSAIKITLDALEANLNLIQRSDGRLANGSVGPAQLDSSLSLGVTPATLWSGASVSYSVGQSVFYGFKLYSCIVANVSNAGAPPLTNTAQWSLLADFTANTLTPGSVTTLALAAQAVTTAKLALASVDSTILATGAVTSAALAAGAVTSAAIGAGAVVAAGLGAGAVGYAALASGVVRAYPTRAGFQSLSIGAGVQSVLLFGYATEGDCAPMYFKKVGTPGVVKPWHVQSGDGAWWILASEFASPFMFGAVGSAGTNDATPVSNWLGYLAASGAVGVVETMFYIGATTATSLVDVKIIGSKRRSGGFAAFGATQTGVLTLVSCLGWVFENLTFSGVAQAAAPPTTLLKFTGCTQCVIKSVNFDTAVIALWLQSGGYCTISDLYVAGCTTSYIRCGGLGAASQFSETIFSDVILDGRNVTTPTAGNYLALVAASVGTGIELDAGSAFLQFRNITGAGMKYGFYIHNSIDSDAWPTAGNSNLGLANRPDGILMFQNINFDFVYLEAIHIASAGLVTIGDLFARSIGSFGILAQNFGNLHLSNPKCYASNLGGMQIQNNFYEVIVNNIAFGGNAWPSSTGGIDVNLTAGTFQGQVIINGGEILNSNGTTIYPVNGAGYISQYGITVAAGYTGLLRVTGVTFGGHSSAEITNVVGNANCYFADCPGIVFNNSGTFAGTTNGSGVVLIPHGLKAGTVAQTPTAAAVTLFGSARNIAYVTGLDATNIQVTVINDAGTAIASTALNFLWSARMGGQLS